MRDTVSEKDRVRCQLLRAVYEATNGDRYADVDIEDFIASQRLPREAAEEALFYLTDKGLLEMRSVGSVNLTHRGIVELEDSIRQPRRPTQHLTPAVIQQHFHAPVGAVQNAANSAAHVAQNVGVDASALLSLIAQLRVALPALPAGQRREAGDLVDGLEAEAKTSGNASRMRAFAGALAKSAGATAVQESVKKLIALLGG